MLCALLIFTVETGFPSEPPAPTPGKDGQKHEQPNQEKNQIAKNGNHPAKQSPSPINQPQPPQTGNVPTNTGGKSGDKTTTDWWLVCFTAVLAGVAVLQFFALIAQAVYMGIALSRTRKTVEKELRAYITLETDIRAHVPTKTTYANPKRHTVSLIVHNRGKTWARHLRIQTAIVRNPKGDPFDEVKQDPNSKSPIVLGPNQRMDLQIEDIEDAELPKIWHEEALKIYVVAWITYEDTVSSTRKTWQTQLSQRINADSEGRTSFSWMPTHNCADDDCEKQYSEGLDAKAMIPPFPPR